MRAKFFLITVLVTLIAIVPGKISLADGGVDPTATNTASPVPTETPVPTTTPSPTPEPQSELSAAEVSFSEELVAIQQSGTPYPDDSADGSFLPIILYVFILAGIIVIVSMVFLILQQSRNQ